MLLRAPASPEIHRSKFVRVNKKNPCKICGKPDYCTFTADGSMAFCMRVSMGAVKQANNRAWIHVLNPGTNQLVNVPSKPPEEVKRASADTIDAVYSKMLEYLPLHRGHFGQLTTKRGLSPETIEFNGYKSIPTMIESRVLCNKLEEHFDLDYVPGFFFDEVRQINARGSGIFVPYRDVARRIKGMQIRLDSGEVRYIWFSSTDKPQGAPSGTSIHYANPSMAQITKEIYLTEGALKADCIAEYLDEAVMAIGGVTATNYDVLVNDLSESIPEVEKVILAFDIDWKTNPHVRSALQGLYRATRQKFVVHIEDWNPKFKGFDDYLHAKNRR